MTIFLHSEGCSFQEQFTHLLNNCVKVCAFVFGLTKFVVILRLRDSAVGSEVDGCSRHELIDALKWCVVVVHESVDQHGISSGHRDRDVYSLGT